MKFLKETIGIINKQRVQNIEIIDKTMLNAQNSTMGKLYEAVFREEVQSDDDAIAFVYGTLNEENKKKYRQLKSRFRIRVLNTLFFLDLNNKKYTSDAHKAYYECNKALQTLNIITKYDGNLFLTQDIIKEYFPIAQKYEFYDITTKFCLMLIHCYASTHEKDKLIKYEKLYRQYMVYQDQIDELTILLNKHRCIYFTQKIQDKNLDAEINEIAERMEIAPANTRAYLLKLFVKISSYDDKEEYTELNKLCEHGLDFLKDKKYFFYKQAYTGTLADIKVLSLIKLKRFDEGMGFIDEHSAHFFETYIQDSTFKYVYCALNAGQPGMALTKLKAAINDNNFDSAAEHDKEKLYLCEAYIIFYLNYLEKGKYEYNIGKLINRTPNLFRLKEEFNLSIQVIKLLFLLGRNKLDEASSVIQSLMVYKSRYLKAQDNIRDIEFIKLLLYFDKNGFNKSLSGSLSEKFKEAVPADVPIQDQEIIMYETILDIIDHLNIV